jgi:hypothetical protein
LIAFCHLFHLFGAVGIAIRRDVPKTLTALLFSQPFRSAESVAFSQHRIVHKRSGKAGFGIRGPGKQTPGMPGDGAAGTGNRQTKQTRGTAAGWSGGNGFTPLSFSLKG